MLLTYCTSYRNQIIQNEIGGGIVADEMEKGKTLSGLTLMNELDSKFSPRRGHNVTT